MQLVMNEAGFWEGSLKAVTLTSSNEQKHHDDFDNRQETELIGDSEFGNPFFSARNLLAHKT